MNRIKDNLDAYQYSLETWAACVKTINARNSLMMTRSVTDSELLNEIVQMNLEKVVAANEIQKQLQTHTLNLLQGKFNPLQTFYDALKPVNDAAKKNVRRLSAPS